ncbi:MAG: radical SAM protein [Candidatus Omnitrophica bacterium]|nr:radical SAM protein [Candidatus Omnitrophota bacterium]
MELGRKILNTILSGHTFSQKANYIKYLLSKKEEVLAYDPVTISIVATGRCTLNCHMCPTHSSIVGKEYPHTQKTARDMDLEMFRYMIDRFGKATTVHIIGSGEPLLNEDFFKMVDYAASKKMRVKTFSNGTIIEKNIDNILNSKLDGITISINGQDPGEFKRMTGMDGAIYLKIYDATRRLIEERNRRKVKIKVKLSFIIDNYNYKFIPEMIETSLKLGVDHAFFCNFLSSPYTGLSAPERVLMAEEKTKEEIRRIFAAYPPSIRKRLTPPVLLDTKMDKNACDTHFTQIRFDGDGNVSSCSMMLLDMTGHGTYKDDDVWNNEFFRKMRRVFLKGKMGEFPDPCKVCPDNKGVKV